MVTASFSSSGPGFPEAVPHFPGQLISGPGQNRAVTGTGRGGSGVRLLSSDSLILPERMLYFSHTAGNIMEKRMGKEKKVGTKEGV